MNFISDSSKEILISVILSIVSIFTITYFITRLFITSYVANIGYDTMRYSAIVNEVTIHSLTWSIGSLVFIIIYTFTLAPISLRVFYSSYKDKLGNLERHHPIIMSLFIFLSFLSFPLVVLIFALKEYTIEFSFIFLLIPTFITFSFLLYHKSNINISIIESLVISIFFTFLSMTTFFPFYFLLANIDYSNIKYIGGNDLYILAAIVILFIAYSFIYGMRVLNTSLHQYIADFFIAFSILGLISIFSPNTLILPIVELSGIKDKSNTIYEVTSKDFNQYIKPEIDRFWNIDTDYITCTADNTNNENCHLIYSEQVAENNRTTSVYLNTTVIYRDDKNEIFCSPKFSIKDVLNNNIKPEERNKMLATCINVPIDILEPTALSESILTGNKTSVIIDTKK